MSVFEWVIVGVIILAVFWALLSFNRLVSMRQQCDRAFADIDVQLKRRHDLVPNLVDAVKGYAAHERGAFDAVVAARNAAAGAEGPTAKGRAESVLGGALRQIFALAEAYPNLKADANFQRLQYALAETENRIAESRRTFNSMVQGYNTMIRRFPTIVFARVLGFVPHEFFNVHSERSALEKAPDVRF